MKLVKFLVTMGLTLCAGTGFASDKKEDKNLWSIAKGSAPHSTLVAAIETVQKDADAGKGRFPLVTSLNQAGPYTVFAPTNAAFDKLPKGTVEGLLKDTDALENILLYHVFVGSLDTKKLEAMAKKNQTLDQASLEKVTIGKKGEKLTVNGVEIVASIYGNNGWIHVIESVLTPPAKKK